MSILADSGVEDDTYECDTYECDNNVDECVSDDWGRGFGHLPLPGWTDGFTYSYHYTYSDMTLTGYILKGKCEGTHCGGGREISKSGDLEMDLHDFIKSSKKYFKDSR